MRKAIRRCSAVKTAGINVHSKGISQYRRLKPTNECLLAADGAAPLKPNSVKVPTS